MKPRILLTALRDAPREWALKRQMTWPEPVVSGTEETARIIRFGQFAAPLSRIIIEALEAEPDLPEHVRSLPGMSGQRYRSFINALVKRTDEARYLEIGSLTGSTAVAAIAGNRVQATCIDDWSQYRGTRSAFLANVAPVRTDQTDLTLIEKDFRAIDFAELAPHNIYLFDGPHEEVDHYDGIDRVLPALTKEFVLVIDDWNNSPVRMGTLRALHDRRVAMQSCVTIRTAYLGRYPRIDMEASDWHNGYFIAHCVKPD